MRLWLVFAACLAAGRVLAQDISVGGRLEQGGIAIGTAPVGSWITYNGRTVPTTYVGRFVLGFERDAPARAEISIKLPKNAGVETRTFDIKPREWAIERVNGLPEKLVKPNRRTQAKIEADNKLLDEVRERTETVPFFETGFIMPAEGKISGVFGSQRILNGEPRAPHVGLDIAAPVGTPVRAAADGVVSLAKADMVLTGKTVVLEHGFGLDSVYIHLNAIKVKEGQILRQGDIIGEVGKSGRTNGPHLHFGITWYNTRLDPQTIMAVLPAKPVPVKN